MARIFDPNEMVCQHLQKLVYLFEFVEADIFHKLVGFEHFDFQMLYMHYLQ